MDHCNKLIKSMEKLISIVSDIELYDDEKKVVEKAKKSLDGAIKSFEDRKNRIKSYSSTRSDRKYDFASMNVGDYIDGSSRIYDAWYAWENRHNSGMKMKSKKLNDKQRRLWRIK